MSGGSSSGEICSPTGGVKSFEIAGRMLKQRERLYYPMTDEERRWRAQFLKDQILAPGESVNNFDTDPRYYLATRNIFRRIYHIPLNILQQTLLEPRMGKLNALIARNAFARFLMGICVVYGVTYYFKYNRHSWEHNWGWDVFKTRARIYPGDPEWPNVPELSREDFYDRGFSESAIYKNIK